MHPSLPQLFDTAVPFTVLDETQCALYIVHGRQESGPVVLLAVLECTLPSVCFVIHILSLGIQGGIGANIV